MARVAFGSPDQETLAPPDTALERRYVQRALKQRLRQALFRKAVITVQHSGSGRRDIAHRLDKGERLGQPMVPKGLPLSKIHAAFDAHLIGIDPDYRLHVSERLLGQNDGQCSKPRTASRIALIATGSRSGSSGLTRWPDMLANRRGEGWGDLQSACSSCASRVWP